MGVNIETAGMHTDMNTSNSTLTGHKSQESSYPTAKSLCCSISFPRDMI